MKWFSRLTMFVLLMLVSFVTFAQKETRPGEGISIAPAVPTWLDALPVQAVLEVLLENLGYEVDPAVALANPVFYQSVTLGDIDYWPAGWIPLHEPQFPADFDEHASIVGTIVVKGALEGYFVDIASIEKYGITSLDDFRRPEVKEAFDVNGDGKADLIGCPPGWGCHIVINEHMDVLDLRDHINVVEAAYSAGFADVLARYMNGEPVLYYTWTPNHTILELVPGEDVLWINVTEGDEYPEVTGIEHGVTDPLRMGFPANDISIVANNDFLDANPAVRRLFEVFSMSLQDISEMTARVSNGEDSEDDLRAMALEWILINQDTVNSWLYEARQAAQ